MNGAKTIETEPMSDPSFWSANNFAKSTNPSLPPFLMGIVTRPKFEVTDEIFCKLSDRDSASHRHIHKNLILHVLSPCHIQKSSVWAV